MGNLIITNPQLSDDATIVTVGNELSTLPAANLQKLQPTQVWRSSGLTSLYLVVDLLSSTAFDLIMLVGTNASSTATWQIRTADTLAFVDGASPPGPFAYDSGSISHWPQTGLATWDVTPALKWFGSSPQTNRYVRIDVTDASNADGYYEAGRLIIAKAWQPTENIAFGWELGFVDDSTKELALGGQTWVDERGRRRVFNFELGFQTEAEMFDNAFDLDRRRGTAKDVVAILDPDETNRIVEQTVHGLQNELPPITNIVLRLYTRRFRLRELI